ncbi:MAG: hypothetical protein AABZ47_10430 [Planctomycetota bacterium]
MLMPPLTHLQFAVIDTIGASEKSGAEIRDLLKRRHKISKTLSGFYMFMKRLEDADLITGRYEIIEVAGYKAKERHYKVTGHGFKSWEKTRDFYIEAGREWAAARGTRTVSCD